MLASYGKAWSREDFARGWNEFLFNVVMYQSCASVADGKKESCDAASAFWDVQDGEKGRSGPLMHRVAPGRTIRELCREEDVENRGIPVFAHGPKEFLAGCLKGVGINVPADKRDAVCNAVAPRLDDPRAAAEAAATAMDVRGEDEIAHIAHDLAVTRGLIAPKDCASPDPFKVEMCEAAYGYRKGRCGKSALCRMLAGGGRAACEPYALKARGLYCGRR